MDFIDKIRKVIKLRHDDVVVAMTNGNVDSMENYKYIIGQINALEATRQELSNLLEDKEQKNEGTVIDINDAKTKN